MKPAVWLMLLVGVLVLGPVSPLHAQTYAPMVTMTITMPDGSSQDVSVADSGLATLKAKDGTAYDVSATVHDEPFTTVTIRFFTPPSTNDPGSLIGEVQAKKGAGPVATKTTPSFKVAVKAIELRGKSS